LPVYDIPPPHHTQDGEYHRYDPFGMQPSIDIQPDEKTETNASGHGQPDLHDNGKVFSPGPVFFIIKKHQFSPGRLADLRFGVKKVNTSDNTSKQNCNHFFQFSMDENRNVLKLQQRYAFYSFFMCMGLFCPYEPAHRPMVFYGLPLP
jgi:hypothetical protein